MDIRELQIMTRTPVPCSTWDGRQDAECGRDAHLLILLHVSGTSQTASRYGYKAQAICEQCVREMYAVYLPDDLISITEAAGILGHTNTSTVSNRIRMGDITPYTDPDERNPRKARRVSRAEVESL